MIGRLVLENLKHRPLRSLLSILLIGVPVTLILSLVGLTHGMTEDTQNRQRGVGADIVVRGSTATSAISFSPAAVPEALVGVIEKQPHVRMALGVNLHNIQLPLVITGVDMAKFKEMNGGFNYLSGHELQADDDILLDRYVAEQKKAKVGSSVDFLNRTWHVAGIIDTGKLARIVVKIGVLQDLDAVSHPPKVTQIYVKVDDQKNIPLVVKELKTLLPSYSVDTMKDLLAAFEPSRTPGVKEFTMVVVAIGVVIGFFVVCLSMYTAVLQRTREIGILKSLGAGKLFILQIILLEALVMGIGGTIVGVFLSFGAYGLIRALVPTLAIIIVPSWWPIAGGITLVGAALGSLYPGWNAASHDPIEALSYE
ncbi:MAG TPA: FtsX-like permease family protein [Candidatus Sulfopaludibacter sp.]|nr:FtsX-like permease family protein [Candidatus Sulfopaludibacter sp.]